LPEVSISCAAPTPPCSIILVPSPVDSRLTAMVICSSCNVSSKSVDSSRPLSSPPDPHLLITVRSKVLLIVGMTFNSLSLSLSGWYLKGAPKRCRCSRTGVWTAACGETFPDLRARAENGFVELAGIIFLRKTNERIFFVNNIKFKKVNLHWGYYCRR
jgi:hypothetical protein